MKKGLKNIWLLGAASFFNDVGGNMIAPILPLYITFLGGGGIIIGLISGLRDGIASLFNLFGGWFSDKLGKRKIFVISGYTFSSIAKFFIYLSQTWPMVVLFSAIERVGKLRDSPRDAIIAKSIGKKHQAKGFGIDRMMDKLGVAVGVLIVIALFWFLNLSYRGIILIAACLAVISIVPLFFVKDVETKKIKKTFLKDIKYINKNLKYLVFVTSVFAFANFSLYMFLILRAEEVTGSRILALVMYFAFSMVSSFLMLPFSNLSDKIGRKKVLYFGYFLFFFMSLGFALFSSVFAFFALFILYGVVFAVTESNQLAFVSDLSGRDKGTSFGLFYTLNGFFNIAGGIIAGILWSISPKTMFLYLAGISLLVLFLFAFVKQKN